jgi:tetraacyldisaccharide 4'-kinase
MQKYLQQVWYGGREPSFVLRALSGLYGAAVSLRRAAYRKGLLRVHRVGAPVVVVGNFVAGGSGKTPFVIALVEHLCARGWSPGVVSRGYGRRSRGQVVVEASTPPQLGGDEPALIARRTGVPVVVDADRVAAAQRVIELGSNIVIADDGLQHHRLHRDFEIEVVDAGRRYGNARLLPAGPLREPHRENVDLRVENGRDAQSEAQSSPGFRLVGTTLYAKDGRAEVLASWRGRRVHAVAGIGHPQRFFDDLRDAGLEVIGHAFTDHHDYDETDLHFAERLPIVMTEKDWVKCAAIAPANAWYLPVNAECSEELFDMFDRKFSVKLERQP